MATHPLSFSEVLEDEYKYFYGRVPYEAIEFNRKQIREIGDLARRLDLVLKQPGTSRWHLLAQQASKSPRFKSEPEEAILDGLKLMLADDNLLNTLLRHDDAIVQQIANTVVWRGLLRVPVARRLLLIEDKLAPVIDSDPDFVDCFAGGSAAIRLLLAEKMGPAFKRYPALLSAIADDPELEYLLVTDGEVPAKARRDLLREFFASEPRKGILEWIRAHGPRRFRRKAWEGRSADLTTTSYHSSALLKIIGGSDGSAPGQAQAIPSENLSRFNAILIETVYASYISDGQTMRALYAAIHKQETAALCLSGGGIRSATFNLGILQGLADHRMLNRLHYISTVSGGGYIGSWLSSWMRRHHEGAIGVAKDLSRQPSDPLEPEVKPIQYLREYSAYLAPRATAFSLDSWTLVATYVRNLLLNWTMLIPALAAALVVPRMFEAFIRAGMPWAAAWAGWGAVALAVFAVIVVGMVRPVTNLPVSEADRAFRQRALFFWFAPLASSGFLFCIYWSCPYNVFYGNPELLVLVFAAGSSIGAVVFAFRRSRSEVGPVMPAKTRWAKVKAFLAPLTNLRAFGKRAGSELVFALVAGGISGWLLHFAFSRLFPPPILSKDAWLEVYVCLGVPLYLLIFFIEATLLVGFTTLWSKDYDREWWARGAAAVFVYNSIHVLGTFAVVILPVLLFNFPEFIAPIGGISGAGGWLLSRMERNSRPSPDAERTGSRWLMPVLRVAAAVALLFFVALISIATSKTLGWMNNRSLPGWLMQPQTIHSQTLPLRYVSGQLLGWQKDLIGPLKHFAALFEYVPGPGPKIMFGHIHPNPSSSVYFQALRDTRVASLLMFTLIASIIAILMSALLNVNVYSMHSMYRNRLIRAYLGASRWQRRPDPFTGFDPRDNIEMWKLRPQLIWPTSFIDFTGFALDLATEQWWIDPLIRCAAVVTARPMLATYNAASAPARLAIENDTRVAVADAVNELMRTRDLKHNIEAPSTLDLLDVNRAYLEYRFESLRKRDQVERLDTTREPLAIPRVKGMPKGLRNKTPTDVRSGPPLHVLNTALNLVGGDNLAWQERKAASFTVTPLHAGSRILAYRDSAEYAKGISLGTTMAISGAAVSPNRGMLSSPTFTFLMTLFNARLGWWLGNPAMPKYAAESPTVSILSLLREALGRTDKSHPYVHLSDGGHFDNLGLYEMVLRRCKYIIVCDATADSGFGFSDLANAVRKVRIDLGISIEPLVTKYVGPQKDERFARYCAFGLIRYQDVDGGDALGYLLYIKPCVLSDCPADVRNYAKEHQTFPHETTVDQFFSESQFESYRALGRHMIGRMCGDQLDRNACVAANVPVFFANAWAYVHGETPPSGDSPVGTISDIVRWMQSNMR